MANSEAVWLELLVEDRSGAYLFEPLVRRMLRSSPVPVTLKVRAHKGLGHWPNPATEISSDGRKTALSRAQERGDTRRNLLGPNYQRTRGHGLYHFLGAKLRAYERLCQQRPLILGIVQDADRTPYRVIERKLEKVISKETDNLVTVLGIAVEELESWLLADEVALFRAYPNANRELYERYQQDSIIGTWEYMAQIILGPDYGQRVVAAGYPLAGKHKTEWAQQIGPKLRPRRMNSPSFRRFERDLHRALERYANA